MPIPERPSERRPDAAELGAKTTVATSASRVLPLMMISSTCSGVVTSEMALTGYPARGQAAQRVFLEVRPSNPNAIALYHDEGFNEIGRRPRYYPAHEGREDAIVMAKELLPDTLDRMPPL